MSIVSWKAVESQLGADRGSLLNLASKAPAFYEPFDICKKSGGMRHIDNPLGTLKRVQSKIYKKFLKHHRVPDNMVGGVSRKSVYDNAFVHVGQRTLVKMDLRNHFGRISHTQVFDALRRELEMSPTLARIFTQLTTIHGRLPQGAPTSSMLANLVVLPAHREISELARARGLAYTIFVDDLTFSGLDVRASIQDVVKILMRYGFAVQTKKLKIRDGNERQETTGLVVNKSVSVSRTERDAIRSKILELAKLEAISEREFRSIHGRISYVSFVNEEHGRALASLAEKRLPTQIDASVRSSDEEWVVCNAAGRHRYRPI